MFKGTQKNIGKILATQSESHKKPVRTDTGTKDRQPSVKPTQTGRTNAGKQNERHKRKRLETATKNLSHRKLKKRHKCNSCLHAFPRFSALCLHVRTTSSEAEIIKKKRIRNEAPLTASPSDLVLQILWIQNHNTEAFIKRRTKRQTRTYRALGNRPERDIRKPGQTGIPICRNTLER